MAGTSRAGGGTVVEDTTFCVWVAGEPSRAVRVIARSVASGLAHVAPAVVLTTGPADQARRDRFRADFGRLVEVSVGGPGDDRADVVVPGDLARAGESAR